MIRHDEREVCDADCMRANNCHGFAECGLCRERFCVLDLDDGGLCPDCAEKADAEREVTSTQDKQKVRQTKGKIRCLTR